MAATVQAPPAHHHHQPSPKTRGGGARCQICDTDLSAERIFFRRYRACPQHVHANQIQLDGVPHRFCQQCGRFHSLDCFDGDKRSCREQLAQHAARRRYLYRLRRGGGDSGAGRVRTSNGGGVGGFQGGAGSSSPSSGSDIEGQEGANGSSNAIPPCPVGTASKRPRTEVAVAAEQHLPSQWLQQQQQACGWQRIDSGKNSQQQAAAWQRSDSTPSGISGLSSTHQLSFMEAAAALAAAAVAELGTPKSPLFPPTAPADQPSQQQHTKQLTPPPSPSPMQQQPQPVRAAAELNQWVDEQLRQQQGSGSSPQHLHLALDQGGHASQSPAAAGAKRRAAGMEVCDASGQRVELAGPSVQHARQDIRQAWSQLWEAAAAQPSQRPSPSPQLQQPAPQQPAPQQPHQRVIWRPVPRRVKVLAPSLSAAVAAGKLPLGVAAAQAQPLASLMHQLQRQAGAVQPHELVKLLETLQPQPTLVAVPVAPPVYDSLPTQQAARQLEALLAKYAPALLG